MPESLEDYFQKGALMGQKAALNLWIPLLLVVRPQFVVVV